MRSVTISKKDYDEICYPIAAQTQPKDMAELKVCDKVLTKLEQHGQPKSLTPEESSEGVIPFYRMEESVATIEFDDNEADLLARKIEEAIPRLSAIRARSLPALINRLKEGDPEPEDAAAGMQTGKPAREAQKATEEAAD